jgi:hypothetical protein
LDDPAPLAFRLPSAPRTAIPWRADSDRPLPIHWLSCTDPTHSIHLAPWSSSPSTTSLQALIDVLSHAFSRAHGVDVPFLSLSSTIRTLLHPPLTFFPLFRPLPFSYLRPPRLQRRGQHCWGNGCDFFHSLHVGQCRYVACSWWLTIIGLASSWLPMGLPCKP